MIELLTEINRAIEFILSLFTMFLGAIGIQIGVKILGITLIIILIILLTCIIAQKIIKKRSYIGK